MESDEQPSTTCGLVIKAKPPQVSEWLRSGRALGIVIVQVLHHDAKLLSEEELRLLQQELADLRADLTAARSRLRYCKFAHKRKRCPK